MNISILADTKSYKKFQISLEAKECERYFAQAAKSLSEEYPIKGFRPGSAPFDIVKNTLSEKTAYEEVARHILVKTLPQLFETHKMRRLGDPFIEFTALKEGGQVTFEVSVALWPPITLPAYRDITITEKKATVGDQEVQQALDYLQKARKAETMDDAFAKSLGNFTDLASLKESIKEGIAHDKSAMNREKSRGELLEKVRQGSKLEVAPFLVEREAQRIIDYERQTVESNKMTMKDYLAQLNMTEEKFIENAREMAQKRLENALILNEIATQEKLTVSEEELTQRINQVLSRFSTVQEAEKALDPATLKERLRQQLLEEKVFSEIFDKQILTT